MVLQPMHFNADGIPYGRAVLMSQHHIAAAAHTGGTNETVWRTTLDLHNTTSGTQPVVVEWLPAGQANPMADRVELTLAPYGSVRYDDAVSTLFGAEGSGALRIVAEYDAVRASSRTLNDAFEGTYGQGLPTATEHDIVSFGEVARLIGLSQSAGSDSGFRTNIGVENLGSNAIEVMIDLYDGDGGLVRNVARTVESYGQIQVNAILPPGTAVGSAEVWTSTPGGRFVAYGSVVDNITGDPTYIASR
jgi:hypothetical protein